MLNIWQVYYNQQTKANCFKDWHLYNNDTLTEHFENSVIVDLYHKGEVTKDEYFGLFSHKVKQKILFKEDGMILSPESLKTVISGSKADVYSFFKRRKQQNIVYQAENYHKGFIDLVDTIMDETGFMPKTPTRLKNIVLFNHFVARSEIYQQYIEELLIPAMGILEKCEAAYNDAKYKKIDQETRTKFLNAFGVPYYPYHPFILERLPSIFFEKYKYNFKQIF